MNLLDTWYQLDENAVPAKYCLVTISSHFPNFVNRVSISISAKCKIPSYLGASFRDRAKNVQDHSDFKGIS